MLIHRLPKESDGENPLKKEIHANAEQSQEQNRDYFSFDKKKRQETTFQQYGMKEARRREECVAIVRNKSGAIFYARNKKRKGLILFVPSSTLP